MQPAGVTTHLPSPREAARPQRLTVRGAGIPALNFLSWLEVQKTGLRPWPRPGWSLELVLTGVCDLRPSTAERELW